MKKLISRFQDISGGLFSSQDSKYFIKTSFKMAVIPTLSFGLVFYSIWNLMEMNFSFFVANGFHSGDQFKDTFYQAIFGDIANYGLLFMFTICFVFFAGLAVSWLALRPFGHIEKHVQKLNDGEEVDLEVLGLNKNKLIYQVARIYFKYLEMYQLKKKAPKIKLPERLENLNKPILDKAFLVQYALVVTTLCLVTSVILYSFTIEFYEQIVDNSTSILGGDKFMMTFISGERELLEKIMGLAIWGNVIGYISISLSIIKSVDGVSYGFSRDMIRFMNGEHDVRLRPRHADPGKSMANTINDYLDEVVPEQSHAVEMDYSSDEIKQEIDEQFETTPPEEIVENTGTFNIEAIASVDSEADSEDEFYAEVDEDEVTATDITITQLQPLDETATEELHSEDTAEADVSEDLPPAFIQEKQDQNGDKVFHITTPNGMKVDNLSEDMVLKIVNEIENKKAS